MWEIHHIVWTEQEESRMLYPLKKLFKHDKAGKNHLTSQQVVMKEPIKVGMTSSYIELGEMTNQLF